MNRREFCTGLATALVSNFPARAQEAAKRYRLALLSFANPISGMTATGLPQYRALHAELRRLGYVEGRNLVVNFHSAGGDVSRIPAIVQEILAREPDVIFVADPTLGETLKTATARTPIVAVIADPIATGLAASMARPGRNITGFSIDPGADIVGKRIELLVELVPTAKRMAWLTGRRVWDSPLGRSIRAASERAGMKMIGAVLESPVTEHEYRRVFAGMIADQVDCLQVSALGENALYRQLVVALCADSRLPANYFFRADVIAGGLMAYAIDLEDIFRRSASYIDRILKGAKPSEMPFQQPTKFDLIINIKTAKALGLTVPPSLLARADEVIE